MPPVKTVASSTDVDNDATAELPVLDVAAYEATLDQSVSSTDTWTVPTIAPTVQVTVEAIPTLLPADTEDTLDLSATHEMPVFSNKVIKATPMPPSAVIVVPPSPPLIEDLRGALATAERRIEEDPQKSFLWREF